MSRIVHHYALKAGQTLSVEVPSGAEILTAMWRQEPEQNDPTLGEIALYVEKPCSAAQTKGRLLYGAKRRLEAFYVPTGKAFDQAGFGYVGSVAEPSGDRAAFWHVFARLTEIDG